jgi:hypothetical protein
MHLQVGHRADMWDNTYDQLLKVRETKMVESIMASLKVQLQVVVSKSGIMSKARTRRGGGGGGGAAPPSMLVLSHQQQPIDDAAGGGGAAGPSSPKKVKAAGCHST